MTQGSDGVDTPRLVLVGSVIVDLVLPVPALPARGGDVLASGAQFRVGGGRYVLLAAARAGMPTAYAGRHGAGPLGDRVRAALGETRTTLLLPPDAGYDTGVCVVMVEPDGERTFVTSPGVEAALDVAHLACVEVGPSDWVYLSGYDLAYPVSGASLPDWIGSLDPARSLVLDPGPLIGDIPGDTLDAVLARTNVLTLNRRERSMLAGTDDIAEATARLRPRLAADALVVLRDGPHGAVLTGSAYGDALLTVAGTPVTAVDTTGAGDIHTGALIAYLAVGDDALSACERANQQAAQHVTRQHHDA